MFDKVCNKLVLHKFLDAHILFEGKTKQNNNKNLYFWFAFNEEGKEMFSTMLQKQ